MPKLKSKNKKGSPNGRKKTVRSETYIKKKARVKRLAKSKQGIRRRVKKTRRNRSQDARRIISKKKSRAVQRRGKTTETRSNTRIQTSKRRILSRPVVIKGYSREAKRLSKNQGYSSKVKVKNSKYFPDEVLILKKSETTLTKANSIKVNPNKSNKARIFKALSATAKKKFHQLGKSKDNLRLIKLQYTYTLNGKRRISYFSSTVSKIINDNDTDLVLEDLILEFENKLKYYLQAGFSDIRISGLRMHAYESE